LLFQRHNAKTLPISIAISMGVIVSGVVACSLNERLSRKMLAGETMRV